MTPARPAGGRAPACPPANAVQARPEHVPWPPPAPTQVPVVARPAARAARPLAVQAVAAAAAAVEAAPEAVAHLRYIRGSPNKVRDAARPALLVLGKRSPLAAAAAHMHGHAARWCWCR